MSIEWGDIWEFRRQEYRSTDNSFGEYLGVQEFWSTGVQTIAFVYNGVIGSYREVEGVTGS